MSGQIQLQLGSYINEFGGFWPTDEFRPVDERWPVSEGQLTDGLTGLPKVGKPYWLVRNTIICYL